MEREAPPLVEVEFVAVCWMLEGICPSAQIQGSTSRKSELEARTRERRAAFGLDGCLVTR